MDRAKLYRGGIAIIGWLALLLQFYLAINKYLSMGRSMAGSVIQLLSYFTILTNLLVALSLTVILIQPRSGLGAFFAKPSVSTSIAVYITVVGLVYNLVLRPLWKPEGLDQIADELLHSVIPLMYIIYWLILVPKGSLKWKQLVWGLAYPLVYSVYALIRGDLTGLYPYPFMDVLVHGYYTVFSNMLVVLAVFLLISLIFLFVDRKMKIIYLGKKTGR
jgi:hypothetical protein